VRLTAVKANLASKKPKNESEKKEQK